jgi:hypothetical protein
LKSYHKEISAAKWVQQLQDSLQLSKSDLERTKAQNAMLKRKAHARAGMLLGMGFLGCFSQLGFFSYTIYGLYGWNDMEPVTWMFCKCFSADPFQKLST